MSYIIVSKITAAFAWATLSLLLLHVVSYELRASVALASLCACDGGWQSRRRRQSRLRQSSAGKFSRRGRAV